MTYVVDPILHAVNAGHERAAGERSSAARRASPCAVEVRPFTRKDGAQVLRLLSFLPRLYPGGEAWLERRLADVLDRKAYCTVAVSRGDILGVTIETPKGKDRLKLSTVFVRPQSRRMGVGEQLISACHARWLRAGVGRVHVTCAMPRLAALSGLLSRYDFKLAGIERDRYGDGRDEAVLLWEG